MLVSTVRPHAASRVEWGASSRGHATPTNGSRMRAAASRTARLRVVQSPLRVVEPRADGPEVAEEFQSDDPTARVVQPRGSRPGYGVERRDHRAQVSGLVGRTLHRHRRRQPTGDAAHARPFVRPQYAVEHGQGPRGVGPGPGGRRKRPLRKPEGGGIECGESCVPHLPGDEPLVPRIDLLVVARQHVWKSPAFDSPPSPTPREPRVMAARGPGSGPGQGRRSPRAPVADRRGSAGHERHPPRPRARVRPWAGRRRRNDALVARADRRSKAAKRWAPASPPPTRTPVAAAASAARTRSPSAGCVSNQPVESLGTSDDCSEGTSRSHVVRNAMRSDGKRRAASSLSK